MMKNESKYEECLDIMDAYETEMLDVFNKAYGIYSLVSPLTLPSFSYHRSLIEIISELLNGDRCKDLDWLWKIKSKSHHF